MVSANTDVAANTAKVGYTEPIYTLNTLYPELGGYVIAVRDGGKLRVGGCNARPRKFSNWYEANDLLSNASNHDTNGAKFKDWRLPTKRELNLMYVVYNNGNGASLNANFYWSSTEYDYINAWLQISAVVVRAPRNKSHLHSVRAVRAF